MGILKRLLGRDRYVLFSPIRGYFDGTGFISNSARAKKYTKGNAEAVAYSFYIHSLSVAVLKV